MLCQLLLYFILFSFFFEGGKNANDKTPPTLHNPVNAKPSRFLLCSTARNSWCSRHCGKVSRQEMINGQMPYYAGRRNMCEARYRGRTRIYDKQNSDYGLFVRGMNNNNNDHLTHRKFYGCDFGWGWVRGNKLFQTPNVFNGYGTQLFGSTQFMLNIYDL